MKLILKDIFMAVPLVTSAFLVILMFVWLFSMKWWLPFVCVGLWVFLMWMLSALMYFMKRFEK